MFVEPLSKWAAELAAPAPLAPATLQIAGARRYAARVRIVLAFAGALLLALEPHVQAHPLAAGIGCALIALTGMIQLLVRSEGWTRVDEALSCAAVFAIVGLGEGRVTALTLIWLSAAAVGVLARGGRAGNVGRLLVIAALLAPMALSGRVTAQEVGVLVGALALLLLVGRLTRETARLLRDPLTDAVSRASFRAQVDRVAARARPGAPAALIMVDFDDFGVVNKQRGYAAGDALLRAAASAMQGALRPGDVLGRLGGDEFGVLTADEDPAATARHIIDGSVRAGIGACAGVARAPRDGAGAEELLGAADFALRMAKRAGKGRVLLYEGASLSEEDPAGARGSLGRLCDGEGLSIVLEPILDLRDGSVLALEALPDFSVDGHEDALHWITLADTVGMRPALELACLRKALALLPDLPKEAHLAVKLAAGLLTRREVQRALSRCPQLDRLIVEVGQERMLDGNPELAGHVGSLRGRGVRVAVEEVGAGHADLGQLALISPDYVKLDRSALRNSHRERSRSSLLCALADHARQSSWTVIAAGIETVGELAAVRAAGIGLGQGPLLAPAVPAPRNGGAPLALFCPLAGASAAPGAAMGPQAR